MTKQEIHYIIDTLEFALQEGTFEGHLLETFYSTANNSINTLKEQLNLYGVINWLACKDELPSHGETVLTYTPTTDMAEEQIRLIKYGSLKMGFPAGVTHWKALDKPTCL